MLHTRKMEITFHTLIQIMKSKNYKRLFNQESLLQDFQKESMINLVVNFKKLNMTINLTLEP